MTEDPVEAIWTSVGTQVVTYLKVCLLKKYPAKILHYFNPKIDRVVRQYTRYLPSYVAESEIDDLKTIAQLEFLETLKVWNPTISKDIWPLAHARVTGAMKDHIR